jgi:hypothetical protein
MPVRVTSVINADQIVFEQTLAEIMQQLAPRPARVDLSGSRIIVGLKLMRGRLRGRERLAEVYVNPNFLWFTLFVGLNLFQSAFTQWCPMMTILRKAGLRG